MGQHRPFELLQLRARIEPELVEQVGPCVTSDLQRIALAAAAVERRISSARSRSRAGCAAMSSVSGTTTSSWRPSASALAAQPSWAARTSSPKVAAASLANQASASCPSGGPRFEGDGGAKALLGATVITVARRIATRLHQALQLLRVDGVRTERQQVRRILDAPRRFVRSAAAAARPGPGGHWPGWPADPRPRAPRRVDRRRPGAGHRGRASPPATATGHRRSASSPMADGSRSDRGGRSRTAAPPADLPHDQRPQRLTLSGPLDRLGGSARLQHGQPHDQQVARELEQVLAAEVRGVCGDLPASAVLTISTC